MEHGAWQTCRALATLDFNVHRRQRAPPRPISLPSFVILGFCFCSQFEASPISVSVRCKSYCVPELSTASMASDGSAQVPGGGQMNIKNKVTVALCFALMIMLPINDAGAKGPGAGDAHAKPTFMHLPMRLRNPRGIGMSHQGARASIPVPELHNPSETEECDSVPEDDSNSFQGDSCGPSFAHLPQHIYDPRGVHASSRPMKEENADPVFVNQVESATPEVNQVRFSHLPRLHNPRGVRAAQAIHARMSKESGSQAGDEGDEN